MNGIGEISTVRTGAVAERVRVEAAAAGGSGAGGNEERGGAAAATRVAVHSLLLGAQARRAHAKCVPVSRDVVLRWVVSVCANWNCVRRRAKWKEKERCNELMRRKINSDFETTLQHEPSTSGHLTYQRANRDIIKEL